MWAAPPAPHGECAVVERDALAHSNEAVPALACSGNGSRAIVDDFDLECGGGVAKRHVGARRAAVLARVRQRFLHDPVRGEVEPGRQRPRFAVDAQLDLQARSARLREQWIELGDAWLWVERELVAGGSQDAEQAAHLAEGVARGRADRAQRLSSLVGILLDEWFRGAGLDDDHTDRVSDHVV